jgi:hypothetical protein
MDATAIPLLQVPALTADPRGWGVAVYAAAIAGLLIARSLPWPARIRGFAREVCLLFPAALLYFLVRGITAPRADEALARSERLIDLERALGIFVERDWQREILQYPSLVDVVNWVYIWAHWPVIASFAIWIWFRDKDGYRTFRNALLISGAIGLVIFALFPIAPPRLVPDWGFVDTVTDRSHSYRVLQPSALTNRYAAMPSLHFGWDLLVGIGLVRYARFPLLRLAGVLLPIAMFASIVLTGNHFVLDGVAGGAVALTGLALATAVTHRERKSARRERAALPRGGSRSFPRRSVSVHGPASHQGA